jgi:hypothetical protein
MIVLSLEICTFFGGFPVPIGPPIWGRKALGAATALP